MNRPRHWIFDLDGTLTESVHDFAAFKASVGLPVDQPILESLGALAPDRAAEVYDALDRWERGLALQALAAPAALALLTELQEAGCRLGILTRNSREVALLTLHAAGFAAFFEADHVLGRAEAPPKPSPAGVLRLLAAWRAAPADAVMVGDWDFDVMAGRAAGVQTILVDRLGRFPVPPPEADRVVPSLAALLAPPA